MLPEVRTMSRSQLMTNFLGRNSYYGLIFGTILSILFYLIIFQFSLSLFILYFAVFGAGVGSLLGGFNGLISGQVTLLIRAKSPGMHNDAREYSLILLIVSVITTFVSGYIIFNSVFLLYAVVEHPDNSIVLLATLLASGASGYASQLMARWYLDQEQPPS
jgi:hypothetical protein